MRYVLVLLAIMIASSLLFIIGVKKSSKPQSPKIIRSEEIRIIESIFNKKVETFNDEGVVKISIPRNDVTVSIKGHPLDPFMGLTTWIAFQKGSKQGIEIMAMGDLVLLEHEVDAVMSMALDQDIKITALHNHFMYDQPKIYFMHIEAEGNTHKIAEGLKKTIAAAHQSKEISAIPFPKATAITGSTIEKIVGVKGQAKNGMFKLVIGRQTKAGCGCILGKNMGINTWAAFAGTDDNAIVDGDFVILENELQPVLKALRAEGISIVAIHNHMINEHPRLIFLHYWGHGSVTDLANGIKKALDKTSTFQVSM